MFTAEQTKYGISGYKFTLINSTYDRKEPPEDDCYKGTPTLWNGLSDVSKCYFGETPQ